MGLIAARGQAQFTNVLINNVNQPNEPCIWINPFNTNHLVAGSNLNWLYYSFDGGASWQKKIMTSSYGVWGDPVIINDTAGHFYFFHLSNPPNGNWIDRIVCQKSTDGGITWSDGTFMGLNGTKAQDKEWAVLDPKTNTIYVTWTQFDSYGSSASTDSSMIMFSKSTDGGMTWSPAKRINRKAGDCVDSDHTAEGAVPAVGPNGEVYVCWSRSDTLWFDRSLDGGTTWLEEDVFVTEHVGGWDLSIPGLMRCNGMPVTKCDLSGGPFHGTIYVNWADQRNGPHDTDVFLTRSTDGGQTWSPPVRVNDDVTQTHQFFTWMDVDQHTGILYFIFYDRRNYTNQNTDVYLAYSIDGGQSFTNVKISSTSFNPSPQIFFGDYTNISAYKGKVAPIWTRMDGFVTSIWTALIDFSTLTQTVPFSPHAHLQPLWPNPAASWTHTPMEVADAGYYTLQLRDLSGVVLMSVFENQWLEPGIRIFPLPVEQLSPGTYLVVLQNEGLVRTRHLVVVR